MEITFAPHEQPRSQTLIDAIATRIGQEGKKGPKTGSVIFAVMNLDQGVSPVYTSLKDVHTMTIKGTLNYQACDDKLCFNPQAVPLSWTIDLRPLDTERAKRDQHR